MTTFLTNAFSLNMLNTNACLIMDMITPEKARQALSNIADIKNAIGHPDTARIVQNILDVELPTPERMNVSFMPDKDIMIVAQYTGPRLPEGATELPEGAVIQFWEIY